MSLTVVGGLPGAGSPEYIYETLFRGARGGRRALLVVPHPDDAGGARALVSAELPVGLRVATLDGVIQAEWGLRGDGRRLITRLQRDILCRRALGAAGFGEQPGRGLVALVAGMAVRHAATGQESRGPVPEPAAGLISALRSYRSLLSEASLVEPGEVARLLASTAPAAVIGAIGFVELQPAEELVLTGWARAGADVLLEVPWSEGVAGTQPSDPVVARLRATGAQVVDLGGPGDDRPVELRVVAGDLFAGRPLGRGEGAVRLGTAQGDEAESRLISAYVHDLVAGGARPGSITIAFADPARHAGWLRRALDDEGLVADWDVYQRIGETPLGRATLHLWAFCRGGNAGEDLVSFVRSPFSGATTREADLLDVALRRRGETIGPGVLSRAGRAAEPVKRSRALALLPITTETGRKWKALLDLLMRNAHPGRAPVLDSDGRPDAAAHRAFCHAVEEVLALGEGAVLADELFSAFSQMGVGTSGVRTAGSLLVTSVDRVPAVQPAHLILGGLTASEFPRRGTEDRIEGDAVRAALTALEIDVDVEEQARAERLAFYLAVTSARRSLSLVRRESDDEGRALRESLFWDEFLDLYRAPGEPLGPSSGVELHTRAVSAGERYEASCTAAVRGEISDRRVIESLATAGPASPGAIEIYLGCPYRWFVERCLRPEAPDIELDRMAVGRVAHEALAAFYRRWWERAPRVTAETAEEAVRLARECVAEATASAPRPRGLEEEHLLADVAPGVEGVVERDAAFLPEYAPSVVEWSFGMEEGDEPVDLGGVLLRGRADRIDIGPQGLMVVDYKRSRAASLADIRREGLVQLQLYAVAASKRLGLPVAGGVYRSLSTGEARGFVRDDVLGLFKPRDLVDGDELERVLEEAVVAARDAVAGMRSGRIQPSPKRERCAYCSASPFCREAMR
jgi:ATP-dependent helicase/nuclease subunit B